MAWRIERVGDVASTNDLVAARAAAGEPSGLVIVATSQRAGRGRRDRTWVSPPGGLYMSALVRPRLAPRQAGLLALAAGLAVARAADSWGIRADLRWPNDIIVGGRKLAGVLCATRLGAARIDWAVVGIGLNVKAQPGLRQLGGVSTEELGARIDVEAALQDALLTLAEALGQAEAEPERLIVAWSAMCPILGREVLVATPDGQTRGRALRVLGDGALEVAFPEKTVAIRDPDLVQLREIP